jgi:hypothetical protein
MNDFIARIEKRWGEADPDDYAPVALATPVTPFGQAATIDDLRNLSSSIIRPLGAARTFSDQRLDPITRHCVTARTAS